MINWADGNALRQQTLFLSNACYNQNDQRWLYSIGCCQNFCGIFVCSLLTVRTKETFPQFQYGNVILKSNMDVRDGKTDYF